MSKPIDQELLPCPFCGAKAESYEVADGQCYVYCVNNDCNGQNGYEDTRDQAKKRWNRRASVQPAGVSVLEADWVMHLLADRWPDSSERIEVELFAEWLREVLAAAPHPESGEQKAIYQWQSLTGWIDTDEKGATDARREGYKTRVVYDFPPTAQDVAGLVEMLDSMVCAYRSAILTGYDRITDLGGQCDAGDYMLAAFPDYAKAKAMVAAHRAQQGEQKP